MVNFKGKNSYQVCYDYSQQADDYSALTCGKKLPRSTVDDDATTSRQDVEQCFNYHIPNYCCCNNNRQQQLQQFCVLRNIL